MNLNSCLRTWMVRAASLSIAALALTASRPSAAAPNLPAYPELFCAFDSQTQLSAGITPTKRLSHPKLNGAEVSALSGTPSLLLPTDIPAGFTENGVAIPANSIKYEVTSSGLSPNSVVYSLYVPKDFVSRQEQHFDAQLTTMSFSNQTTVSTTATIDCQVH